MRLPEDMAEHVTTRPVSVSAATLAVVVDVQAAQDMSYAITGAFA
jgi:hypothetical protein